MSKKLHPADIANRANVLLATEFSVYQYRFRDRYTGPKHQSLAAAAAEAAAVEMSHPARPCLIYAYLNGIAHPVPADLRAAASAQSEKEKR